MKKVTIEKKTYPDGSYATIEKLDGQFHGWWISYNKNHGKKWERFMRYGNMHGPERNWRTDGTLENERSFENNLLHGPAHQWHPNGQLKSESWYHKGQPDLYGRWYSHKGKLIAEMKIENGQRDGTQVADVVVDEEKHLVVTAIVTHKEGRYMGYRPLTEEEQAGWK